MASESESVGSLAASSQVPVLELEGVVGRVPSGLRQSRSDKHPLQNQRKCLGLCFWCVFSRLPPSLFANEHITGQSVGPLKWNIKTKTKNNVPQPAAYRVYGVPCQVLKKSAFARTHTITQQNLSRWVAPHSGQMIKCRRGLPRHNSPPHSWSWHFLRNASAGTLQFSKLGQGGQSCMDTVIHHWNELPLSLVNSSLSSTNSTILYFLYGGFFWTSFALFTFSFESWVYIAGVGTHGKPKSDKYINVECECESCTNSFSVNWLSQLPLPLTTPPFVTRQFNSTQQWTQWLNEHKS